MKRIVYTLTLALCAGGMLVGTAQAQCSSGSEGQRAQCCHNKCYNQRLIPYETCFNGCMGRAILNGRSSSGQALAERAALKAGETGSSAESLTGACANSADRPTGSPGDPKKDGIREQRRAE